MTGATSPSSPSKHWGPERTVEIVRAGNQGLGISIVGGKVEPGATGDLAALTGIFIKNVLEGSPAAALGCLNTGDRILAVGEVDLRTASHDTVVEAIRQAANPLQLTVQSLRVWAADTSSTGMDEDQDEAGDEAADDTDAGYNYQSLNVTATSNSEDLDRTVGGEEVIFPDSVPVPAVHEELSPRKVTPPDGFKSFLPEHKSLIAPPTPSPRTNRSLDLTQDDFVSPEQVPGDVVKTDFAKSLDSDITTESDNA